MSSEQMNAKLNLLIGVTGSVATIKLPILIDRLQNSDLPLNVKLVVTERSCQFFDLKEIREKNVDYYRDQDEWNTWKKIPDPVIHIELRKWANFMLIAPLDANSMAKIAHGICDNLLTSVVRAWDRQKPLLFAPAMNTFMWNNDLTTDQINKLKGFGFQYIPVVSKKLACGDYGPGAMAEVDTLVDVVRETVERLRSDMNLV